MVVGFNLSATLNVARLFKDPKLCIPSIKYANFNEIQLPLPSHIKAIVLDKDNCFAKPHDDKVWPEYQKQWDKLKQLYPGKKLLIVSNSAGTNDDTAHIQAKTLEKSTGVPVLLHSIKKPGCHDEIMAYFKDSKVCEDPSEVAVVGDRLFTDVVMANTMGAYSVWLHEGVIKSSNPFVLLEQQVYNWLQR
ncbi:Gep4 [Kluyveromyces lactis]|nr:Gep4 [Kluyveromyces lactis]